MLDPHTCHQQARSDIASGSGPQSTPHFLSEKQRWDIISRFQPMLLRYRADLAARLSGAGHLSESFGRLGGAEGLFDLLLGDVPKMHARVLSLLVAQETALQRSRLTGVTSVVVEALLALYHQRATEVLVGDVAKNASAILYGRGERIDLEPRAVGSVLDDLGVDHDHRTAKGLGFVFTKEISRHVHELARDYRVPNLVHGCHFCQEVFGDS